MGIIGEKFHLKLNRSGLLLNPGQQDRMANRMKSLVSYQETMLGSFCFAEENHRAFAVALYTFP